MLLGTGSRSGASGGSGALRPPTVSSSALERQRTEQRMGSVNGTAGSATVPRPAAVRGPQSGIRPAGPGPAAPRPMGTPSPVAGATQPTPGAPAPAPSGALTPTGFFSFGTQATPRPNDVGGYQPPRPNGTGLPPGLDPRDFPGGVQDMGSRPFSTDRGPIQPPSATPPSSFGPPAGGPPTTTTPTHDAVTGPATGITGALGTNVQRGPSGGLGRVGGQGGTAPVGPFGPSPNGATPTIGGAPTLGPGQGPGGPLGALQQQSSQAAPQGLTIGDIINGGWQPGDILREMSDPDGDGDPHNQLSDLPGDIADVANGGNDPGNPLNAIQDAVDNGTIAPALGQLLGALFGNAVEGFGNVYAGANEGWQNANPAPGAVVDDLKKLLEQYGQSGNGFLDMIQGNMGQMADPAVWQEMMNARVGERTDAARGALNDVERRIRGAAARGGYSPTQGGLSRAYGDYASELSDIQRQEFQDALSGQMGALGQAGQFGLGYGGQQQGLQQQILGLLGGGSLYDKNQQWDNYTSFDEMANTLATMLGGAANGAGNLAGSVIGAGGQAAGGGAGAAGQMGAAGIAAFLPLILGALGIGVAGAPVGI